MCIADKDVFNFDVLTEYKIDGALITNPTSLHVETAIEIANHGIPMFIEKPLGNKLDKVDKLLELVKAKNIHVMMGYNMVYHPCIVAIKELINGNKIGKVISARAQFGTYMPDWHKDEDYKKGYAANSSMGGGVVMTSIHEQNYLTNFFGEVTEIKAMEIGGDVIGIDAEEGVEILIKHKSNVVSNIHLNFFQKPYHRNCEIIGTDGTIFWDFMKPEIRIFTKDKNESVNKGIGPYELLETSYVDQMKGYIEMIKNNVEPKMNLEKGIDDVKTALKILKEINRNYN